MYKIADYNEVWVVDFEFYPDANRRPEPVCLVAHELKSGRQIRLWRDEMAASPPYPTGPDSLFVSYFAPAEIGCHLALNWPVPARVLDLFAEFRCLTNGLPLSDAERNEMDAARTSKGLKPTKLPPPRRASLLGALAYFGLPHLDLLTKTKWRDLVLTGGPWSEEQRAGIIDYCRDDVVALERLLPAMSPSIDLPRALLRGRYMVAVARMTNAGIPIDLEMLRLFLKHWDEIQLKQIEVIDEEYGVFKGLSLDRGRFADYLAREKMNWPLHPSGALDLSQGTFREMAKVYPQLMDLYQVKETLGQMRLNKLEVGADGRNRTMLSPFGAKTSRNLPSSNGYIFGPSAWMRGLIKPPPGYGIAYIDWSQQEFGIAAALSEDKAMMEAYSTGDPYLAFAKQAGAVTDDATKQSHGPQRDLFKACALAVQYGMEEDSLALRIKQPPIKARELLRLHRQTYWRFWEWSDAKLAQTMLEGHAQTCFLWTLNVGDEPNPRSLANFPMQAHGAEMMRLAACLATEAGIEVAGPVHDAFMIVAPLDVIDGHAAQMQEIMAEASALVLRGFRLRADVAIVRYPDRYMDKRGAAVWDKTVQIVEALETAATTGVSHG